MRKITFILIPISFIVSILVLIVNRETTETITYFPIDDRINIESAFTSLQTTSMTEKEKILLDWTIQSTTKTPLYLRQDVSLLYKNGYLLSIINVWQTNTELIQAQESFQVSQNSLFQSISFHHGEHHVDQHISSVQQMTQDYIFIACCQSKGQFISFKQAHNLKEEYIATLLDEHVKNQLNKHWEELMRHFNINVDDYELIPLFELAKYNDQPLPHLSKKKTMAVIGQLWEGLYKNYIVPLSKQKNKHTNSMMPLILYDLKGTHLIVLYKINDNFEQLYQRIHP